MKEDLDQLAREWIEYWEIRSGPTKNTRAFRKAIETGDHPLSSVGYREAKLLKNQPEMA